MMAGMEARLLSGFSKGLPQAVPVSNAPTEFTF
jgi:hypothetical protein